jgi:hypothetical protein
MVGGIEGVGEAITGGLLARSVEPAAGEAAGHGETCLNCGATLVGGYCHRCGQAAHVHRTIGAFWHDVAHSVLHFDGKIWRTLPLLAWKPGELTRRYIAGERARFVSPMALFLFSVFLMFAVFSLVGGPFTLNGFDRDAAVRDLAKEASPQREQLERLRTERARLVRAGLPTRAVDMTIATVSSRLKTMDATRKVVSAGSAKEAEAALAETGEENPLSTGKIEANTGWPRLDQAIEHASENPKLLAYKIQSNGYKFSWALIPISVPFLWLLFLHRRRYRQYRAYDHTVFITYSIAFMSLGLIVLSLLRPIGLADALVGSAMVFVPPIHMYRQLRGAYALSRWSAVWRTFMLVVFASIAAMLFFMLLVAMGAFAS